MARVVAAGIFLVRKDNMLLVCHPTNHDKDFWSITKGKVEDGETLEEAAIRETFEESNIDLRGYSLIPLESVLYRHKKKILHSFVLFEKDHPNLDFDSFNIKCNSNVPEERGGFPEMDAYKFISIDEARTVLHYTQVASLDAIEKML